MTNLYTKFPAQRPCRTKIVATVGPASDSEETLSQLVQAGVDVFRVNCAHQSLRNNAPVLQRIRKVSEELQQPIAILADLAGPKMRLGTLAGDSFLCENGKEVQFVRNPPSPPVPGVFSTTYEPFFHDLSIGDRLLLADGTIVLQVVKKDLNGTNDSLICRVIQGGTVRSRQGINLPGIPLSIGPLQPQDIENAKEAVQQGVDFLGLSFVRSPDDIMQLRAILEETARDKIGVEKWNALSSEERSLHYPNIIAKIEKQETLNCLDEIVQVADGLMVARGDLGVEIDIARIAVVQKQLIALCRRYAKPVIVATQMLESMTEESLPTRAEATDVANAILDGADACMLSGESAIGKHPVLTVQTMNRIAAETEKILKNQVWEQSRWGGSTPFSFDQECFTLERFPATSPLSLAPDPTTLPPAVQVSLAVCHAAGKLADTISASMIFAATKTGRTARNLSNMRNFVRTVGTSDSEVVLRRMCLYWGVVPVGSPAFSPAKMLPLLIENAEKAGFLQKHDLVVFVAGVGTSDNNQNVIYVHGLNEIS